MLPFYLLTENQLVELVVSSVFGIVFVYFLQPARLIHRDYLPIFLWAILWTFRRTVTMVHKVYRENTKSLLIQSLKKRV